MGRSNTSRRGPLPAPEVRADEDTLTRFAGTIPLIKYLSEVLELPLKLDLVVDYEGRKRPYGIHHILFAFVIGALVGVERLAHIEWLNGDAVLLKFLRLPSWPVRKVFSNALAGLTQEAIERLQALLTAMGLWALPDSSSMILDFDSSSIVSFGEQEGAVFGYCGKGRNRRRHHPLVASVAATRAVVHAEYRDGSAIDAKEAIAFFEETVRRVRARLAGCLPTIRADSGFWSIPMMNWLLKENLPFVMAFPLRPSLKLMLHIAVWETLEDDPDIQLTSLTGEAVGLDSRVRVVAIRRFVHDASAPPQGKEILGDHDWRYQALVTSLDWAPLDVWRFYNGRADCERIFKVGKHALGMNWLVSHDLRANEAAFLLRMLAFNVDILFQRHLEEKAREEQRPTMRLGLQARQHRFYNGVGRWLREHGRWVLRVARNARLEKLWAYHAPSLIVTS